MRPGRAGWGHRARASSGARPSGFDRTALRASTTARKPPSFSSSSPIRPVLDRRNRSASSGPSISDPTKPGSAGGGSRNEMASWSMLVSHNPRAMQSARPRRRCWRRFQGTTRSRWCRQGLRHAGLRRRVSISRGHAPRGAEHVESVEPHPPKPWRGVAHAKFIRSVRSGCASCRAHVKCLVRLAPTPMQPAGPPARRAEPEHDTAHGRNAWHVRLQRFSSAC